MTQAKQGDTVKVNYTGKVDEGQVFDTSVGREPIEFTLGEGMLIPGFEEAVQGMIPGESKTIEIPSEKAYGSHNDELAVKVEKEQFPEEVNPQIGDRLQVSQPDGQSLVVTVTDLDDQSVTLDANHPLAGKDLTFDIELVEIV